VNSTRKSYSCGSGRVRSEVGSHQSREGACIDCDRNMFVSPSAGEPGNRSAPCSFSATP
jgi:hypothetical protein